MRKRMWSAAATLVVLLSGAGVVLGSARVLAADGRVAIVEPNPSDAAQWHYDPLEVTVTAGSAVVWHNAAGNQAHTVTADDMSFDSSYVKPGGDFRYTFSAPGDFKYHCTPHPWMRGAVVHVVGASTPTPAPTTAPTTAPPTPTTRQASSGTPATTATTKPAAQASTTTTTAKAGAATASTTTTVAAVTTTTLAPAAAPTSAPESAGVTTTTSAPRVEEVAAGRSPGGSHDGKSNPVAIALAAIATLAVMAIGGKLLASKS